MTINRKIFFDEIRQPLFKGSFSQAQVEGIELIISEFENRGMTILPQLAYILATPYHETGATMQPIEEKGKGIKKPYGRKIKYDGSIYFTPNIIFYGRGYTQNTWYEVYESLTILAKRQGKDWDFLNNPELLLQEVPSIWAMFEGMTRGLYTCKKLSNYITDMKVDFFNASRIINILERAE